MSTSRTPLHAHGAPGVPERPTAQDGPAVLLLSIAERCKGYADQIARARERPTEKVIHDLRVASRRLIATLDVVSAIFPQSPGRRARRQLKRHLRAFSALRDVQIQIAGVRRLARRFDIPETFLTVLKVREKLLLRRARTEILSIRLQSIDRQISDMVSRLHSMFSDPLVHEAAGWGILGSLGGAFTRAAELKAAALSGKPTRIHRFRVAVKRFRYAVEALQPLLPGATKELIESMNDYQTRMGDIQDIEALISCINAFAGRRRGNPPRQCSLLTEHLVRRRDLLIAGFIASGDELGRIWVGLSSSRSAS